MWVGEDGIVRTAALADPSRAVGESLRERLDEMAPGEAAALSLALDDLTEFEPGDFVVGVDEFEYEGRFLPDDVSWSSLPRAKSRLSHSLKRSRPLGLAGVLT